MSQLKNGRSTWPLKREQIPFFYNVFKGLSFNNAPILHFGKKPAISCQRPCCERHYLLCNHGNGDLFAYENTVTCLTYCHMSRYVFVLTWYFIGVYIIDLNTTVEALVSDHLGNLKKWS